MMANDVPTARTPNLTPGGRQEVQSSCSQPSDREGQGGAVGGREKPTVRDPAGGRPSTFARPRRARRERRAGRVRPVARVGEVERVRAGGGTGAGPVKGPRRGKDSRGHLLGEEVGEMGSS